MSSRRTKRRCAAIAKGIMTVAAVTAAGTTFRALL